MSHDTTVAPLSQETFEAFAELMREYMRKNDKRLREIKKSEYFSVISDEFVDESEIQTLFDLIQGTGFIDRAVPSLGYCIRSDPKLFQRTVVIINKPDFTVTHLVRFYRIANFNPPRLYMRYLLYPIGTEYGRNQKGRISFKAIAEGMETMELDADDAAFEALSGGYLPDENDYPFFFNRPHLLLKGLKEGKGDWCYAGQKLLVLRILQKMPNIPDDILHVVWDDALAEAKTYRLNAQLVLDPLPETLPKILNALKNSKAGIRSVAAQWLARLHPPETVSPLREALEKEKTDSVRIDLMKALVACGVSLDDLLDRDALLLEAEKALKKAKFDEGPPKTLRWFPFDQIPAIHWSDGTTVDPKIVHYWLVQAVKFKTPEPNPLLMFYGQRMNRSECETVARFILESWIDEDTYSGNREERIQAAKKYLQSACYGTLPQGLNDQESLDEFEKYCGKNCPLGSANDSKGVLGIVAAWGDETLPAIMEKYVRDWYGLRVHQSRALVVALGGMENTAAIQSLLSISRKMKTKSIREEADAAIRTIAERKNWTLDQLADRTAPTAGLDERREIIFELGARKITARWTGEPKLFPYDESGKQLKTFPSRLKSDDETLYAAAKKEFQAANKLLKTTLTQQTERLYEAMCAGRSWTFEEWSNVMLQHPILGRLVAGLVWGVFEQESSAALAPPLETFRPMEDGTLTDVDDNPVELAQSDSVRIVHALNLTPEQSAAWTRHLHDYEVKPLLLQFAQKPYRLPDEKRSATKFADFYDTKVKAFQLRSHATKHGFVRGETGDGGWFYEYLKPIQSLELVVAIEFNGNALPEENNEVELHHLVFRTKSGRELPLEKVPPILLSEMVQIVETLVEKAM